MKVLRKGSCMAFCLSFFMLISLVTGAWAGNSAEFVSKTVADNTSMTGGTSFKQEWTIKNTGTKTWDSDYKLRYISGDLSSSHSSIKISGKVKPGKTYTFSMTMKVPAAKDSEKTYREEWKFGKSSSSTLIKLWTQIVVPKAAPVVTDDYGNSCSTAADISLNSSKNGKIDFAGDNDYFRVQISSKGTLKVYTTGKTDTYGRLLDSNCKQLDKDNDAGEGDNFKISKKVSAGTYYVAVRHNSSTKTGSYTLNVGNVTSSSESNDHFTWPVDPTNRTDGHYSGNAENKSIIFWLHASSQDTSKIWRDEQPFQRYKFSTLGYHLGSDYNLGGGSADNGKSVYPIANGTVSEVYNNACGWGNIVFVKHSTSFGTYTSMYAHVNWLSSGRPAKGQPVSSSTPIAKISNGAWTKTSSCKSFGSWPYHLHFEIRRGDNVSSGSGYTKTSKCSNESDSGANTCPQHQIDPDEFIRTHN